MASPSPTASILVSPIPAYYFHNAAVGDMLLKASDGGSNQKILLGMRDDQDATLTIESDRMTLFASMALSNATGRAILSTTGSNFGINQSNAQYTLDVGGDAHIASNLTVDMLTTTYDMTVQNQLDVLSDATFMSNLTVLGSLNATTMNYAYSNITVYASEQITSNLLVDGTIEVVTGLMVNGPADFSNSVYIQGASTLSNSLMVSGATGLASTLRVDGVSTLSNDLTVYGKTNLSNAAFLSSNLAVLGASTLSNSLQVYGATSLSNSLDVSGASTLSNSLQVYGATSLSNSLDVSGASTLSNSLLVYGATSLSNSLDVSGASTLSNDLQVYGATSLSNSLDVSGASTLSNSLLVYGATTMSNSATVTSDLTVLGASTLSNGVSSFSTFTQYNADSQFMVLSNSTGSQFLATSSSNLGLGNSNPMYTLDIIGDINFTGGIFNNGAVFSGWNSNAFGNYINSNAAFKGPATEEDVLLAYTTESNLAFSMSNQTGKTSLWSEGSNLGLGNSNPLFSLDVEGSINFTGGIFQNGAVFSGWNSNAFGNYINSNAAFRGESTETDVMLLYTTSNNYAFSFSNISGKTSMYGVSNYLGVGTSAPAYTLDVAGDIGATSATLMDTLLVGSNIGVGTLSPAYPVDIQANTDGISMSCSAKVVATEFSVFSDRRLKREIKYVDNGSSLDALMGLQVCTFGYVDTEERGSAIKTGLIAQEVEEVLPMCVVSGSGYVPNIMQTVAPAPVEGAEKGVYDLPLKLAEGKELAPGTDIKCRVTGSSFDFFGTILPSPSTDCHRVDFGEDSDLDGVDAVLVVGSRVSDLKMLNFEQLTTLTISALQSQEERLRAIENRLLAAAK